MSAALQDTMESVLANNNKVMIDVKKGNNLMYLPLDRLQSRQGSSITSQDLQNIQKSLPQPSGNTGTSRSRDLLRGRGGR